MDYGDESRQMPPVVKKKFPFLKVVLGAGVIGLGVGLYFATSHAVEEIQTQIEQAEIEQKQVETQVQVNQTSKEIIEDITDIEVGDKEVATYICSGENKNEALVFSFLNYFYEDIMIVSKLTFNEEIKEGYYNVADAINNKAFTAEEIYSGKVFRQTGDTIIKKALANENSAIKKYTDEGYSYYVNFTGANYKYSAVRKEYTFEYKVYITLSKGEDKKFIDIEYTAKSSSINDMSNANALTFTEGKVTEYSKDILESLKAFEVYKDYNDKSKYRNLKPLSSRYLAEDNITEIAEVKEGDSFEIGNGRWTAILEDEEVEY